jgi:hypothetical protein
VYRKASILTLFALLVCTSVLFLTADHQEISMSEKRELAKLPQFSIDNYLSGRFTNGINQYINDHFPFRQFSVRFAENLRYSMGFRLKNNEKIVVVNTKKNKAPATSKKEIEEEEMASTPKSFLDDFEEAYSGSMVILNGRVYTLNTGSPAMSPVFARMLNKYADTLKGKVRVFSCVAPLSSAYIPASKYQKYSVRNKSTLDAIKDNLSAGTYFCDVMGEMDKRYNENLWFGSDHHWTALGAYCGYVSFCKSAGIKPVPLSDMETRVKYPFLGSLYELTRDKSVRENPDTIEYYVPNVEAEAFRYNAYDLKYPQKSKVFCNVKNYTLFICGDAPLIKITTNVKNGKRAAVVKNSMGNAFAVYLISHYEEIYVFDFRYSKHNMLKIIEDAQINDLIFALGMYGAMSHGTINMMKNLATHKPQDYDIVRKREQERLTDSLARAAIDTLSSSPKPIIPTNDSATKNKKTESDTLLHSQKTEQKQSPEETTEPLEIIETE